MPSPPVGMAMSLPALLLMGFGVLTASQKAAISRIHTVLLYSPLALASPTAFLLGARAEFKVGEGCLGRSLLVSGDKDVPETRRQDRQRHEAGNTTGQAVPANLKCLGVLRSCHLVPGADMLIF